MLQSVPSPNHYFCCCRLLFFLRCPSIHHRPTQILDLHVTSTVRGHEAPHHSYCHKPRSVTQLVSIWILTSCQPHRITSGHSDSVISKCTLQNLSYLYRPSLKSAHKTNPYTNIHTQTSNKFSES